MSERKEELALQVVDLAKTDLLSRNYHLATAVGRLLLVPRRLVRPFATDGASLFFDPGRTLALFRQTHAAPTREFLHSLTHCLFVHPYVGKSIDQGCWNLACDIVAQRTVVDLLGPEDGAAGSEVVRMLSFMERDLGHRANAEELYRELRSGRWEEHIGNWRDATTSDSHDVWYAPADSQGGAGGRGASDGTEGSGGVGRTQGRADSTDSRASSRGKGHPDPNDADSDGGEEGGGGSGSEPEPSAGTQGAQGSSTIHGAASSFAQPSGSMQDRSEDNEKSAWRDTACELAAALRSSAGQGTGLASLVQELETASRKPIDYRAFLRRFATTGEIMRASDADFDLAFYTYGLALFEDLPLVEPLEFSEQSRVREFIVVVDTSESVQGSAIRSFVRTTFNLLKSTEGFFDHVHVRILQCDNRVHSDVVVRSAADLAQWEQSMRVIGGGGTDFRPAFAYVDDLVERGAFQKLDGLLYFTDGKGSYPAHMPRYKTAFAFYPDIPADHLPPPWAIPFALNDGILEEVAQKEVR